MTFLFNIFFGLSLRTSILIVFQFARFRTYWNWIGASHIYFLLNMGISQ